MKKLLLIILLLWGVAEAQTVGYLRYDTVKLQKVGGFSELVILNKTKDSAGVLTNIGGGKTAFRPVTGGSTYTGSNAVTLTGSDFTWEGMLAKNTFISGRNLYTLNFDSLVTYNRKAEEHYIRSVQGTDSTTLDIGLPFGIPFSARHYGVSQDVESRLWINASGGVLASSKSIASPGAFSTMQIGATAGIQFFPHTGKFYIDSLNRGAGTYALRWSPSTGFISYWDSTSGGGGSGVTTVGTFSGSSQPNGATIASTTITFGPPDGSNPGMMTPAMKSRLDSNFVIITPATGVQVGHVVSIDTFRVKSFTSTGNVTTVINNGDTTNTVDFGGTATKNTTATWGAFTQQQDWNAVGANTGLKLTMTGTASSNINTLFEARQYGTTGISQTTTTSNIVNSRTGTGGSNIAMRLAAYGKANSIALQIDSGDVYIGKSFIGGTQYGSYVSHVDSSAGNSVLRFARGYHLATNRTAALGVQKNSPAFSLSGNGWNPLTSTAGSVTWSVDVLPVQGSYYPGSILRFAASDTSANSMLDHIGFGSKGEIYLGGSAGTLNYVATSGGPGAPVTWVANAGGMTNPMTTTGDIIYSSSGSTPARLGIGSEGDVLKVVSGIPAWSASAGTNIYNTNGILTGNRAVDMDTLSLTFNKSALFRIVDADSSTEAGIYDFDNGVDFFNHNTTKSHQVTQNVTTGFKVIANDISNATTKYLRVDTSGFYSDGLKFNNSAALRTMVLDTVTKKWYSNALPFLFGEGTGTATGAIIGELAGNTLSVQEGGLNLLFIDPTTDAEQSILQAFNLTDDGNNSQFRASTSPTDAIARILVDFNDGAKSASILATANTSTSTIAHTAASHIFNSDNTTGTGTSAALSLAANSLTSGDGLYVDGNGLTTGTLFTLSTTSTVVNSGVLAAIYSTAANSTASKTVRGEIIHILNTGTTSTNVGLEVIAAGATTNYAARFLRGIVSLGLAGDESGRLQFNGITSGVVTIQPASAAGTYTLTLPTSDGAASEFLQTDGNGVLTWAAASSGAALSGLTAATATNDINNVSYRQRWRWESLAGDTAVVINATTTAAASDAQVGFASLLKGANGTSGQFTAAIVGANTHTGTTSEDVGVYGIASGGTYNYGLMSSGITSVNDASIPGGAASHALIVRSLDNTSANGIIVYPNANYGTNTTYGYSGATASADYRFSVVGNDYEINSARTYIGSTGVPTAKLHFAAGATGASTAPLKFTAGTNMTTAEAGAVEFDGTNYFVTSSTTRYTVAKTLTATATLNFGSAAAGAALDLTITVTGAAVGDAVYIGVDNGSVTADNISYWGWVSATNTVSIRFNNNNLVAAVDPASGTFRAVVTKY